MIIDKNKLKEFCDYVSKFQIGKAWPAPMSSKMYKTFTQWQFSDKYPSLLSTRIKGSYRVMRVR